MTETAFGALLILLAGALAREIGLIRRRQGVLLVNIVIHLALPPLVFLIMVRAELDAALLLVPLAAYLIHGILLLLSWAATRVWGCEPRRAGALIVATAVGNTGFFGLPLIAASGEGFSQPSAVMYDALATAVITWTSTVAIAGYYGQTAGGRRVSLRDVGRALLLPPTIALVLGLAVNLAGVHELPRLAEQPLELMAGAVLPLTMLYGGLMLDVRGLGRLWREMAFVVVMRLGIATLVGLAVAELLQLDGTVRATVVIMAAMPTAMMSLVLGASAGLRSDILAGAVALTTLLCTITLPLWRAVLL